jgi:hypothetical protein
LRRIKGLGWREEGRVHRRGGGTGESRGYKWGLDRGMVLEACRKAWIEGEERGYSKE